MGLMKSVTAAILEMNDTILIARRREGDALAHKWEFPGGKIEPGETPEQCLAREMMEEFGVHVQVDTFFASNIYHYAHGSIELLAYRVHYLSGVFVLHVHEEIQWVRPEQLAHYPFAEADIPIAQKLSKTVC